MCLTQMLSSYFHNIVLSCVLLISFFSSSSVPYNCRGQMDACDFRHTQIKYLSLSLSLGKLGNILEFPFFFSLVVYVITLLPVSYRHQMFRGVRPSNSQTYLVVLCCDWVASLGQKVCGWLLVNCSTLAYIHTSTCVFTWDGGLCQHKMS